MLQQHVLQEISSPQAFLRAKACWVYGEFSDIKDENHLVQAAEAIFKQVFAPELPVKLAAALALSRLLKSEAAEKHLKPHLKQILEVYLKMMEEIDSEELVKSLEAVMGVFADDMAPFALQISAQLVQ